MHPIVLCLNLVVWQVVKNSNDNVLDMSQIKTAADVCVAYDIQRHSAKAQ